MAKKAMKNSHNSSNFKTQGFTLIEVMVAAVILFAVIASVSMIYSGAFLSSEKASKNALAANIVPALLAKIKEEIRSQGNSSNESLANKGIFLDANYQWNAKLIEFRSAAPVFSPESGENIQQLLKYKLWQVHLFINVKTTKQNYTYNEISWNDK